MLFVAPYFGYLASLFLIAALLVKNDLQFRWCSLLGNVAFIVYGILLNAVPVLITNVVLLAINCYYLWQLYARQEYFDLIEFAGEEKLVSKFLSFYQKDINAYFPSFEVDSMKNNLNFVVLRNLVIANMFSAEIRQNGDAEVIINYTVKRYRDYKVGRFIFERERDFLITKGVKRIVYSQMENANHQLFLKVMGFVKLQENGKVLYVKVLI